MQDDKFWRSLDDLVAACPLNIDRPTGSAHPRYPAVIYPFDYGYLEGTRSGDGDGVDVWVGSLPEREITGVVCTVDAKKRDAEVKILLGCTPREAQEIVRFHSGGAQAALWVTKTNKPGFIQKPGFYTARKPILAPGQWAGAKSLPTA